MNVEVPPEGSPLSKLMIVGEAPGADEVVKLRPFVGYSGQELDKMLGETGISRTECFITNVCRVRPPGNDISHYFAKSKKDRNASHSSIFDRYVTREIVDGYNRLSQEIALVKPNIILALGNTALWALTGKWGIQRWRGSMLIGTTGCKIIPTYHPAAVLRNWAWRSITVHDIKRVAELRNGQPFPNPGWRFTIRPSFIQVVTLLTRLTAQADQSPLRLAFDLETKHGHIDCAGIAWTTQEALCIPFMHPSSLDGYWSPDEEGQIVFYLYYLLTHPNVEVVGQNLLYDSQYTYRHWHFVPRVKQDTMMSFHTAFAGLPKKLDFQASMFCEHYAQWKPDRSVYKEGG